ncbi:MAG TPA: alpha/beta fold hydrolase [Longimicrobium sp.]|jgi:pimeloyl-ACP methyl ester carboxylesterase
MRKYLLLLVLCTACAHSVRPSAPAAPSDTGRVAVEGGELYYESRGSGPAVVLLHGGGLDHTSWDPQVDPLSRAFRVIRYDARGHGRSTPPTGPFSMADDLGRVLDHLGVRRAHLVGLSMGAGAAYGFAARHPERVETLTLVSMSGPPPGVPREPGAPPDLTEAAGRELLRGMPMPRLLVLGERDSPVVQAVADSVRAQAPGVEVVRIPGAHLPNRDAPEAFNLLLLRFLRQR